MRIWVNTVFITKLTRAPCRRRMGRVVPRAEYFCDLITADHKVLSEGCESRNNHRYAVVGLGPPNGSSRFRAKQKLLRKHKGACKSSWSRIESLKSFTRTIPWNFAKLWRSFLESLYVNTTLIGNKWECRQSSAQSERRDFSDIVAIRSEWKLVGRFHGMLLPPAKRHRSIIWWKTPYERRFWATI